MAKRRRKKVVAAPYGGRFFFVGFLLTIALLAMLGRMVYLTMIERPFLQGQGDQRTLRDIAIPAYRGMINDRRGRPLAVSTEVATLWINPKQFSATPHQLKRLASLLHISSWRLRQKVKKNKRRDFIYLQRQVSPWRASQVTQMAIPGVYSRPAFRRYYPEGQVMAHILGFTNIDDRGQEGLELAFDHWLRGIPGKKRVLKDRYGHIVEEIETIRSPRPGHPLTLSVDRGIQYLAFEAVKKAVTKLHAKSGTAVVLKVKTGEILAMATLPSFNPNQSIKHVNASFRNRAVTDVFEPGSTMKAFSIASALDSGHYTPSSTVDTSPGYMYVDGNKVEDEHNNGLIDVTTILQRSSNMGVAKMTLSLPPQQLWSLLHRMGFGQRTDSGFPGERHGTLVRKRLWRPFDLATLAFGYGVSVTPLQLAHAYATIANHGMKVPVTFLKQAQLPQGKQAISPAIANDMISMLRTVVEAGGTGYLARVNGYTIAGKTGTARIAGRNGYQRNHHVGSFVGMAPATNPQLVVAVVINDPKGLYYGGTVAAPVFAQIMRGALRKLNIAPDHLQGDHHV